MAASEEDSKKQLVKIINANNKLSRGEDLREEMVILVGPIASWEDFLVPTPMAICLLGELMIISTTSDFSLDKNPPKDGFQLLLRYPYSLRACLMQLQTPDGKLSMKHTNMDQIRLLSSNVPGHLKEAVTILLKGKNHELKDMLPIPLQAIQETADNCLDLATAVEKKFEQSAAQLDHTREKYDKACDKLMADSDKLGKIMADIAKLDIQKIDFETIKSTLSKGIKALGELREQWGKVVRFFQMMSNLIKCCLNTSLKEFLECAGFTQTGCLKGFFPISSLKKDMIYRHAFQAAKISHVVNMIAGSYVEISNNHLMDRIAGLGKLLGYDPEKEMNELLKEREKHHSGLQTAQKSIVDLVKKRKAEFESKFAARVNKIKTEIENALPPPTASHVNEHKKGLDADDFI